MYVSNNQTDDGTDGQRTGTDGRTEDDDGDEGTDTTRPTDDIYSSKASNTTLGTNYNMKVNRPSNHVSRHAQTFPAS